MAVQLNSNVKPRIYSHPPQTLQSSNELFNKTLNLKRCSSVITINTPSIEKWISQDEVERAEEMKYVKSCQLQGVSSRQIYASQQMILSEKTITFVKFREYFSSAQD